MPPGPTTVTEQRTTPLGAPSSGHTVDGYDLDRYADSLAFVAKNSISLFSAPTAGLTAAGTLILILERFVGRHPARLDRVRAAQPGRSMNTRTNFVMTQHGSYREGR
jgi:hypothetical protein